jgi:RNA polymerase sigma-70 factor (ECF subfamily)
MGDRDTNGEGPSSLVTCILERIAAGDGLAESELVEIVHGSLQRISQRLMYGERVDHTLQATALVNEAWLRLRGAIADGDFKSRRNFYTAAASAMRRVLIDHARARGRAKRGGGRDRITHQGLADLITYGSQEQVLLEEDAVASLEAEDARVGQVVRLRFYAGLGVDEVASILEISRRTVLNDWASARAWLYSTLADELPESESV